MGLSLKDIDYKKYIPQALTILLLFSGICLTGSNMVIIYACITLISFGYVIYMIIKKKSILMDIYDLWLLLVFLLLIISGLLSPYKGGFSLKYFLLLCVCIACVYFFMKNSKERLMDFIGQVIEGTSVISCIYIAAHELPYFIINFSQISRGYMRYRFGLLSGINPTQTAGVFGILSVITFYFVFIEKKHRLIYVYIMQVIVAIFSGSKKGLVLIALPALLYFFRIGLKSWRNFIIFALTLVVTGIAIFKIPLLYNIVGYRILDVLSELGIVKNAVLPESAIIDNSTTKRLNMIHDAWEMIIQKPVSGWGWNAFAVVAGYGIYSHNNYLEILVSMGIIGFIIYYAMPAGLLIGSVRQKNKDKRFLCLCLIISMLLMDISSVTVYGHAIIYFIYAFLFLLVSEKLPCIKIYNKGITVVDKKDVEIENAE